MGFFDDLVGKNLTDPFSENLARASGLRKDFQPKSTGFLGILKRPDGKVSTELSAGMNINGVDMEVPLLVPGLTDQELKHLLSGGQPTKEIYKKVKDHAVQRILENKDPFYNGKPFGDELIEKK